MTLEFRSTPTAEDRAAVFAIVAGSGFFSEAEAAIAVELVDAALEKGEASGYCFLFAQVDGALVGYTAFGPIPGTDSSWDLYWIAVDDARRGEGVGQALIAATEARVLERGGTRLYADTSSRAQYAPTHRFYERAGYVAEAELVDYYRPGDGRRTYTKVLG